MNVVELTASFFGILYLILIIYKNPWGWVAGFISSLIYIQICWSSDLLIQALLQLFYAIFALVGYIKWNEGVPSVAKTSKQQKATYFLISLVLSILLGYFFSFTNQVFPYLDAIISVFGIYATYLTTQKQVENWIFWIVINILSIILFASQELYFSTGLFFCYFCLSVFGYVTWNKEIINEKTH